MDDFSSWASASCSGGLTLVSGTLRLSGLFIVQQYLRLLLQRDYAVVLVAAEQSLDRYKQVAKKMGLSLPSYLQSGHLTHVPAPLAPLEGSQQGGAPRLQQLAAAVAQAVRQRPAEAAGVALVVDSLTVLAGLCVGSEEWTAFLHYAQTDPAAWGAAPAEAVGGAGRAAGAAGGPAGACGAGAAQVPYCVIAGVYGDVPDDRHWLASLEHRAEVVVRVEPLPGRIADLDGQVTVTRRRPPASGGSIEGGGGGGPLQTAGSRHSLFFRTTELAVKWVPHVTSRDLM